jgi:multiple sugar transport system ATP-binding protein
MGSEVYAYIRLEGDIAESDELAEIAADTGASEVPGSSSQLVTRLSPETTVHHGAQARFWLDTDKLHIFDPDDGTSLGREQDAVAAAPSPAEARQEEATPGAPSPGA